MVGLGNVLGPFIAAGFIQSTSWRYVFFLVCPLAVLSGAVIFFLVPPHTMPKDGIRTKVAKIDFWGIVTSSTAIILLLIPISGLGSYSETGSAMVISMLIIGGVAAVLFVLIEWKVAKLPMIPRESRSFKQES
jgi:MFS family permease